MKKRRGDIVPMHLIDVAIALRIDNRPASKESLQQCRTPGAIDPGQARDDPAGTEHETLGLEQDASGIVFRCRFTFLGDPLAVLLPINARAAREQDCRSNKSIEKIARAVQINATVKVDTSAARTRAMNDGIKILGPRVDLLSLRDIDGDNWIRFL